MNFVSILVNPIGTKEYVSTKIGRFFEGKPTVLVNEGKIIYSNLEKERYSLDDLLRELRLNNIYSIEDVRYAILETNGKLSIFPYKLLKNELSLTLKSICL